MNLTDSQKWQLSIALVVGIFSTAIGAIQFFFKPIYQTASNELSSSLSTWIAFSSTMSIVFIAIAGLITAVFAIVKIMDNFQEDNKK